MSTLKWRYEFSNKARKQVQKLSPKDRVRVFDSIAELTDAVDPGTVPGVKALKGTRDPKQYRQRQGDYRIIFSLSPGEVVVMDVTYKGLLYIHEIAIHHTGY